MMISEPWWWLCGNPAFRYRTKGQRRFASAEPSTPCFFGYSGSFAIISGLELVSETGVWAFAWVMSCTIAHFTHRYYVRR